MIKKSFKLITGSTGTYNIKVGLTARAKDWGWFDTVSGVTTAMTPSYFTVTGFSSSRLSELRKYTINGSLSDLYFTSPGLGIDGLNLTGTTSGSSYVYYLGAITYTDTIVGSATTTTFKYSSYGLTDPNNFVNQTYIKDESKQNIIENPFINSDVFIVRQEIPVFEKTVRLRGVNGLNDIISYAGGNYFTIYNNT